MMKNVPGSLDHTRSSAARGRTLPRLQEIMARGWDLDRSLALRNYLASINGPDLDWEAELDVIKEESRRFGLIPYGLDEAGT